MPHYHVRTKKGSIELDTHDLGEAMALWKRLPNGASVVEYTERGWVKVAGDSPRRNGTEDLEPNRALARQKLEAIAWQNTPTDYRSASGSRRQVLINSDQGTTLVPLSEMTDNQLRRYIGPGALEEADDMRNNGSGIYTGTAASAGDYVIHKKGGQYHASSGRYYADRIGPRGTHQTIGLAKGSETKAALLQAILKDAHTHGIRDGIIFEQTGDELREIGDVRSGRHEPNARREEADETAARELSLYIENEYSLVGAPNSRGKAIEKNLLGHMRRGNFDLAKAEIAYMYLMEDGAKKYAKEFASASDWNKIFTKPTRELVAHEFATSFYEEHKGR